MLWSWQLKYFSVRASVNSVKFGVHNSVSESFLFLTGSLMIYAQHFTSHFIAAKIAQLESRKYFQKNLQHPIVKLSYLPLKSVL